MYSDSIVIPSDKMHLIDYIRCRNSGTIITLRYSINSVNRTFGSYVITDSHTLHPIDSKRIVRDFDDLVIKDISNQDNRIIITLAVGTTWLSKHPKYKVGVKMPAAELLKEN